MADLGTHALRTAVEECAANPELYGEHELALLHVIGLRLEHGLVLSANQRDALERYEGRLIFYRKWRERNIGCGDVTGG